MINVWGVCSFGAGTYDQMTRWDLSCTFFAPRRKKRVEERGHCCANCLFWLVYDERVRAEEE